MRHEYKRKYNYETGRHEKTHIYGEGIFDSIINFLGRHLFSETAKKIAKETSKKAATTALNKTGNYYGNKAGDKIISLLQNKNTPKYNLDQNANIKTDSEVKNAE